MGLRAAAADAVAAVPDRAAYAADSACAAARAAYDAATDAASSVRAANTAAATDTAFRSDIDAIESGLSAADIVGRKLWSTTRREIAKLWADMTRDLLAAGQDWDVWTDWYEARLTGKRSLKALEIVRANIPNKIWDQGPAKVNAEIKGLIEELEPPPRVVEVFASVMAGGSVRASLNVAEPAISAVPGDNPPIAGAATQHHSEVLAAWQSADTALQTPRPGRQYVPDVSSSTPWRWRIRPPLQDLGRTTIPESPFGNKWTERGDRLVIDPRGNETDDTAALDPVVRQLHDAVRRKAIAFATNLTGIDDRIGWTGFEDAIERFREAVDVDTVAIPSRIATVCLSSGFGDPSNTRRCISEPTSPWRRLAPQSAVIFASIILGDRIRA